MPMIQKFEDLDVWQNGRELSQRVFALTCEKPFLYDFPLRDQIKASSGSVMDNITEGFERDRNREFSQFLFIAKGS